MEKQVKTKKKISNLKILVILLIFYPIVSWLDTFFLGGFSGYNFIQYLIQNFIEFLLFFLGIIIGRYIEK